MSFSESSFTWNGDSPVAHSSVTDTVHVRPLETCPEATRHIGAKRIPFLLARLQWRSRGQPRTYD